MVFVAFCRLLAEVHPGKKRAVIEDGVGLPSEGTWTKRPKKSVKTQHGHEWLQNGPGRADGGLLVADLDLAPDEEIDQLAVLPQLAQRGWPTSVRAE